jgi:TatA/E family protein of Tat protein translocase
MPFNIQGPELIIILIIALIVLGPGRLPEVGAALGKSIREFRKAASEVKEVTKIEEPAGGGTVSSPSSAGAPAPPGATPPPPPGQDPSAAAGTAPSRTTEPGR